MSEPYSPNYFDSLGIEYIKEEKDFNSSDYNRSKRELYLMKRAIYENIAYEIQKRKIKNNLNKKRRLFSVM